MQNIKKAISSTVIAGMIACWIWTPALAAFGDQTLRAGMSGEDVVELQTRLVGLGYDYVTIDGDFGQTTEQAVIEFQNARRIDMDGVVGWETFELLGRGRQGSEVSRGKVPDRYRAMLNIKATAYAPGPHDNGQWGNLTYMGTQVRPGIIAVDPNVIPLGSRLYVEFANGTGMYVVAEDIGGAIKGNRIDIAMNSVDEAYNFGVQNVKVYIL